MQHPDTCGHGVRHGTTENGRTVLVIAVTLVGIIIRRQVIPVNGGDIGDDFIAATTIVECGLVSNDQGLAQGKAVGGHLEAGGGFRHGDRAGDLSPGGDAGAAGAQNQLVTTGVPATTVTGEAHDDILSGEVKPELVLGQVAIRHIGDGHRGARISGKNQQRGGSSTRIRVGDPELDLADLVGGVAVVELGIEEAVKVHR